MYVGQKAWFALLVCVVFLVSRNVSGDLVGLWQFDADVSPQPDSSGNGHVGEPEGDVTWVDDPERGGAMEFDGDADYLLVEDTDLLSIEGDLTIAAWANFVDFESWRSIMGKTGSVNLNMPAPYDLYTVQNGDGRLRFLGGDGQGTHASADSADPPELEVWQHIAVTIDEDGEVIHYFDGEENNIGFVDVPRIDDDQDLYIGCRADFVTNMYGMLDDVAIFNEVLAEEQVQAIMGGDFSAWGVGGGSQLQAGDADMDCDFDQLDLVRVQQGGKYLTGQDASWGEGDWNGAPGGSVADQVPPPGDGLFNQLDIIAALGTDLYLEGSYCADGGAAAFVIPEPSTPLLLAFGLTSMLLGWRRRRR